jgi:hypothetical protein
MLISQLSPHSLSRIIAETLGLELGSERFYAVFADSLRYITRVDNAYAYQSALKSHIDFSVLDISAQKFRLKLAGYRSCTLSLRYFMLNMIRSKLPTSAYAKEIGVALNLPWSDTYFSYQLLRNNVEFRRSLKTPAITALDRKTFSVESYRELNQVFSNIHAPLMRYVRHITFSKLRFISTSTNTEFADLHADLLLHALQAFQKVMPCDGTIEYVTNYVKRAIHNHAMNMISNATAEKRSRLVKGAADGFNHGFSLTCVSENQLNVRTGSEVIGYEDVVSTEHSQDMAARQEGELVIDQLLARYAHAPKKHSMLKILTGSYHEGFTDYLLAHRVLRVDTSDNVDAQEQCPTQTFLGHVCEFLGISVAAATEFLEKLGTKLYPQGV